MNELVDRQGGTSAGEQISHEVDLRQAVNEICENAINDAKAELHPLLGRVDTVQLERRSDFVKAFQLALERRVAQKIADWQPSVQAVFRFDESWMKTLDPWDGSIHLLVKVPRLSNTLKNLAGLLDRTLTRSLTQLGWTRFRKRKSILDVQQVTPNELRHGISYGAMFAAVRSAPVKVWSPK